MFSEILEELIEGACADGVLTDKERSILMKRATAEGIDLDEFELILESRLAKRKKALGLDIVPPVVPPVPQSSTPASTSKHGVVKKCPQCGAPIVAGRATCESCGYTFMGLEAVGSAQKFAEGMREIEIRRHSNKSNKLTNVLVDLFSSERQEQAEIDELSSFIKNFPIPNTREDLLEFSLMLKPKQNYSDGESMREYQLSQAYKKKFKECGEKAAVFFPGDSTFESIFEEKQEKGGFFSKLFGK